MDEEALNILNMKFHILIDSMDTYAGTLRRNPKFYQTINAYADALRENHERVCFFYDYTLADWELAMRTNMGGGLPAIGFWEMKQDIYDILKR